MYTTPPQASSLWSVMPAATAGRKRQLAAIQAEAKQQAKQRRARVMAHDWARARLRQIFGYAAAEQWSGYVPPVRDPADNGGAQLARANPSPHRAALVQLLRDVAHFDATGELPTPPAEDEQLALT